VRREVSVELEVVIDYLLEHIRLHLRPPPTIADSNGQPRAV
jgi:hypothetical protein